MYVDLVVRKSLANNCSLLTITDCAWQNDASNRYRQSSPHVDYTTSLLGTHTQHTDTSTKAIYLYSFLSILYSQTSWLPINIHGKHGLSQPVRQHRSTIHRQIWLGLE